MATNPHDTFMTAALLSAFTFATYILGVGVVKQVESITETIITMCQAPKNDGAPAHQNRGNNSSFSLTFTTYMACIAIEYLSKVVTKMIAGPWCHKSSRRPELIKLGVIQWQLN